MQINRYEKVADDHFRETYGLYYEDFYEGLTIEHRPGRTVTETDNIWQSLINMNQHPLHIDMAYGSNTEFKENLVSSLVTFNIVNGLTVNSMSYKAVANLGWNNVFLKSPVFVGDTLYSESCVLSKRESVKRPNDGIVTFKTIGKNQKGNVVIEMERTALIPKKVQKLKVTDEI